MHKRIPDQSIPSVRDKSDIGVPLSPKPFAFSAHGLQSEPESNHVPQTLPPLSILRPSGRNVKKGRAYRHVLPVSSFFPAVQLHGLPYRSRLR